MRLSLRLLCSLILILISAIATAEIYKTVDKDGRVTFTDNPKGKSAEELKLPSINTQPATPTFRRSQKKEAASPRSYRLSINTPADKTHVPTGQQNVAVNLSLSPNLQEGHSIQMYLNGSPYGQTSTSIQQVLKEVYRGQHLLYAAIVNPNGKVLARSDTITLYVQRRALPQSRP